MVDIFISYEHQDREIAAALAGKLGSRGYTVWWDRDLLGGSTFREVIHEQLLQSQYAIVIWSPTSIHSKWVIDETEEAQRLGKLIPTRTASIAETDIPLGFRSLQTLRLEDMDGIVRAIRSLNIQKGRLGDGGVLHTLARVLSTTSSLVNRYSYEYGLHIAICFIFVPVVMGLLDLLPHSLFKNPFPNFNIWWALLLFFPALGWANMISRVLRRTYDHGIFLALIFTGLILFLLYLFIPARGGWQWYSENYLRGVQILAAGGGALWLFYFYRTIRGTVLSS
jgi:hypothetical protein